MSRYAYRVPSEQMAIAQGASVGELDRNAAVLLANIAPGHVITAVELAGAGQGGMFTLTVFYGVAPGLSPSAMEFRSFIGELAVDVNLGKAAAAARAAPGRVIYDCETAGAGDGLSVGGVLVMTDDDVVSKLWLDASQWYIDAINGSDDNSGFAPDAALATHAEFARRLGPLPVVDHVIYVDLLSDLDEVLGSGLEPTFVDNLSGIWYRADPKTVLASDTVTACTPLVTPDEPLLQGTSVVDFSLYEGKRLQVTSGALSGSWCWIAKINSTAVGSELARISIFCGISPSADPCSSARFYTTSLGPDPGDSFEIWEQYRVSGCNFSGHNGVEALYNCGNWVVQNINVNHGSNQPRVILRTDVQGMEAFLPVLVGCGLEGGVRVQGTALLLHGCGCAAGASLGPLHIAELDPIVMRGCAADEITFSRCRIEASNTQLLDGTGITCEPGCETAEGTGISGGIWNATGAASIQVQIGSWLRFGNIWGSASGGGHGWVVNGGVYYSDIGEINTLAVGGGGSETVIGGVPTAYVGLPAITPANNAMMVVDP